MSNSNRHRSEPRRTVVHFIRMTFGLLALLSVVVAASVITRQLREGAQAERLFDLPTSAQVDGGWTTVEEVVGLSGATYHEGRWFIADPRAVRIHVVDTLGRYRFGFGRKGRGPGEFMAPSAVAVAGRQIHAADLTQPVIQVFDPDGTYLRRVDLRDRGCAPGTVVMIAGVTDGLVALQRCVVDGVFRHRVRWIDDRGNARWLDVDFPDVTGTTLPAPVLSGDGESRVVVGDGQRGCFRMLAPPHEVGPLRCPELARAPMATAIREQIARRFDTPGAPVAVTAPDSLPLFDLIAWTPVLSLRHPTTEDSHVWLDVDGGMGETHAPGEGVLSIFSRGKYLAAREVMGGMALTFNPGIR